MLTKEVESTRANVADLYNTAEPGKLFDITQVIGSVYSGGSISPRAAAFLVIAEHDADGTFQFCFDGTITSLTVGSTKAG